jgi:hypothetical protein
MNPKVISKQFVLFLVFYFFICSNKSTAQIDSALNGLRLETKMLYGSVIPHSSAVTFLLDNNMYGAEITLSTESNGRMIWEQLYRFPRYGVGYSYTNLGNPEILGKMHALFGFVDVPIYVSKNKFSLNYQVDLGATYFTKTYDAYNNPLNHLVSSPFTVYIGLDLVGRYKIGEKNELKTALELSHCSNGKTRTPNLGMNAVNFSAAWIYSLKPSTPIVKQFETSGYKKHFVEFLYNVGGKRDENLQETVYLVSSVIADYNYAYSLKYAVGGGLDFFYDGSIQQYVEYKSEEEADNSVDYQMGAHVGFRGRYGRMHMLFNVGAYIFADYLRDGSIYSRLGLRYALTETVLLNVSLKSHKAIADYIEFGVGYRLNTKGI